MARVLIADDDAHVRALLRLVLEDDGYDVDEAEGGSQAIELAHSLPFDAILLDVRMPGMDGLEVMSRLSGDGVATPVVMMSGHSDVSTAVEATKRGAFDFLEKPVDRERLLVAIRNAREVVRLEDENAELRERFEPDRMVGSSTAMTQLRETIVRAAPASATVLVTGPSGSGKELVARAIHRGSKVARGPFIRVNCAAIPEELIESELFGHEKGSFTGAFRKQIGKFAAADGGTIFLDEIGDLSIRAQAKVLRVLQDGEIETIGGGGPVRVKVRVVVATNRDLSIAMSAGQFRSDLFYRLNVIPIAVPPLADRRSDVPELIGWFAARHAAELGRKRVNFTPEAMEAFASYAWPGNVRELANAVERTLILSDRDPVGVSDLPKEIGGQLPASTPAFPLVSPNVSLAEYRDQAERAFIVSQLEQNRWNVSLTAEAIQTPRSNLYRKIDQYHLKREAR